MNIMFAQAGSATSGDYAIWTGVLGIFFMFAKDWMKDRREREESKRRDDYLKDIAKTNQEAVRALKEVSDNQLISRGELKTAADISSERHHEIIRAFQSTCKHPRIQPKETE